MPLESGFFISDLDATNPASGDQVSEGDNHLRLIKSVLKGTFPNASKAIYFPDSAAKTANFSVVSTDMNKTFMVDTTSGTVAVTLPSLAVADAGWACFFVKTNAGTNPILISPASGSVLSGDLTVTSTRRCIPGKRFSAFWSGSNWVVERVEAAPVGAIIDFDGSTLPTGYELPNGQTLASASTNYPDYVARKGSGVTRDVTGRVIAMKESVATRLTAAGGGVDGATLGAAGGTETHTLLTAEIPAHSHGITDPGHTHNVTAATSGSSGPVGGTIGPPASLLTVSNTTGITINNEGGGGAHKNVQPVIVLNKILVVE